MRKLHAATWLCACLVAYTLDHTAQARDTAAGAALEQPEQPLVQQQALEAAAQPALPRLTWDKYIFAEGVNPEARYLDRLMVKFYDDDFVRIDGDRLVSRTGRELSSVSAFLKRHPEINLELIILHTTEDEYQERTARIEQQSGVDLVDLFSFTRFRLPRPDEDPKGLLAEVLAASEVELAYYEGIPQDALCQDWGQVTPDYIPDQQYHDPAPLGTDLDYAQSAFGANLVDGIETTRTAIFERGMQTTHEDVTSAVVATEGTPDADNDHGTSVMGILGGCDDNGVGVLGYLADQQMVLYQRNSDEYGSVADIYDLAASQLDAGELCNSSWAYYADPMPPGQECPCNPGQNGLVPCEYNPDVKAAIQAAVAAGIYHFIGAGNGCVDLDDPVFGDIFQYSTDSGSNIVGGSQSAVVGNGHHAICYTGFGSRVNHYAWAENIYTTGYGGVWTGNGLDEYYTGTFGGTSGATPTAAGCGSVLNNIWRDQNGGSNISPFHLRNWLGINATPNNDAATTPIGEMPNLFGILAPDLAPYQMTGWDADLVPHNTHGVHTFPEYLSPDPAVTYIHWAWVNWSHFSDCYGHSIVYLDDQWILDASGWLDPFSSGFVNGEGVTIRGGLHYLRHALDEGQYATESNEDNNESVQMFVWDGMPLVEDVPQTFSRGPKPHPEGSTYQAKDGFSNGGGFSGYWEVFGVMRESAGNYDIYLYDEAPTATSGFQIPEAVSIQATYTDFVGANRNQFGVPDALWAGVVNHNDSDSDYIIEGDASTYVGALPSQPVLVASGSIATGEILDVFEFNGYAGQDAWIHFHVTGGSGDLSVLVYGPDAEYLARWSCDAEFDSGGDGESEGGLFTIDMIGYHGIVVCKAYQYEIDESIEYDFYLGQPAGDLIHNTHAGWTHELVARNTGTGDEGVLPAILNEGDSVADNAYYNQGSGDFTLGTNAAFYLDGPQTDVSGDFGWSIEPGEDGFLWNMDLGYVKGGRHEVGAVIDVYDEVLEEPPWGEWNNKLYTQYVWAPCPLVDQVGMVRTPPPNYQNTEHTFMLPGDNQDGYAFSTYFWTAVSCLPQSGSDAYATLGYDYHSTDPETAMLDHVSRSWAAPGNASFCVANGNVVGNGQELDFGVYNNNTWPAAPSIGNYEVKGCQSIHDCFAHLMYGFYNMYYTDNLHIYDLYLEAPGDYPVNLYNYSYADLGLAVFEAGVDHAAAWEAALLLDSEGSGADETGTLTTSASGWHGLVIFKHGYADTWEEATYRFLIGGRKPQAITDLEIIPVDVDPIDYYHFDFQFSDVTQDIYGIALEVDYYSLYWSNNPYASFPESWRYHSSSVVSEFLNIPASTVVDLYYMVTAVDEDGFVVASTEELESTLQDPQEGKPTNTHGPVGVIPDR